MPEKLFNYTIIKVLGEGGMSRVYLAEEALTKQKVAIKELLPNLAHSNDLRQRFRQEAQIMAKLDHPNIVKLLRYEETPTSFYLIMEYVDGMDLERLINDVTGPIAETKAIEIMSVLLDAFGYAHQQGVVHRDIKPANIIINTQGKVKILDFGIAKIVDQDATGKTKTGIRIGTVAYMSPEQVNAMRDIDLRTDIYSLGVMLHQMITGKPVYDSSSYSDFEIQTSIVKDPLPRACSIYPYASKHLQSLIDKATEKKRENRFKNCDEFKLALLNSEPTQPEPTQPVKPPLIDEPKDFSGVIFVGILLFTFIIILFVVVSQDSKEVEEAVVEEVVVEEVVVDSTVVEEVVEEVVVEEVVEEVVVEDSQFGSFRDQRDGKQYNTVKIGSQVWMAENLAYAPAYGNYWAYDNSSSNVVKYGYLYDWETACKVCPPGWHLPSDEEWQKLINFVGGDDISGKKLQAENGWKFGDGTDEYGFTALPGGYRNSNGTFLNIGYNGNWWSATEVSATSALYRSIYDNSSDVLRYGFNKELAFSVRCVRD